MIVSCGEALVDLVPEPVPGGGPMNVAIGAARLEVPSAFVGRISTDEHGAAIWDHLRANGVDLRACERGPEETARAIVEHRPELSFRFEGDDPAHENLRAVSLDELGAGPHIVHGGALGLFCGRTAETLADFVEHHGGITSVDPNIRPHMISDRGRWEQFHDRWRSRAHLYRASDEDGRWIWPHRAQDSWAAELLDGGAHAVIVTHGGEGATVFTESGSVAVPGAAVDVIDTVGAGDTFVASMLASVWDRGLASDPAELATLDLDEWRVIARRAVEASAISCSRAGADPPRLAELAP